MTPFTVKARDLRLADTINLDNVIPWGYAIVKQIKDGEVTLFRPYGTTADFSYTGGVIPYVGIDEFKVSLNSDREYIVVERKELK
jgi:hypothetical protein